MKENEKSNHLAGKYLSFFLMDEEYGVEILKVQEIINIQHVTPVPRTPEYLRGVINLRGKIIPVVDLRLRFGMEATEDEETCIIVVETHGITIGAMVDRVHEVLDVGPEDIKPPPSFEASVDTSFLMGMSNDGGRVRLLLNIDNVLSTMNLPDADMASMAYGQVQKGA